MADYSQIELRIMAEVSREPKFIEVYKNNGDLHRQTAAIVTGKPTEEITKEERQQAKAVNFGFLYGMGAEKFKEKAKNDYNVDLSLKEAIKIRELFFKAYLFLMRI